MQAPDVHRPLASLVRLTREDGHEPRLADANPHLILRSSDADPLVIPLVFGVRGFNVSTRARGGRASAHPLARGKPLPDASLPVTCA